MLLSKTMVVLFFIGMSVLRTVFLLCACWVMPAFAGTINSQFPTEIDPYGHYVFYSHGFIVEGHNPKPVHKTFGIYDFVAVKEALADESYHLIAYHRPKGTEPFVFAKKLAADVEALITAGVAESNISLVGFSRGGALSIMAANELKRTNINLIILAGCAGLIKKLPSVKAYGKVYSIFERSDQVGSCQFLIDRNEVTKFEEISINTGLSHGAFYKPKDEWVLPIKKWLKD